MYCSFDLDLPLEVDDDCWDLSASDSNYPLKHPQPASKPSVVSFFVCHMKLSQILAFALRTIVSWDEPCTSAWLISCHSTRSTSPRFCLASLVRSGNSTLLRNSTRLSTSGLTRCRITCAGTRTERTYCRSTSQRRFTQRTITCKSSSTAPSSRHRRSLRRSHSLRWQSARMRRGRVATCWTSSSSVTTSCSHGRLRLRSQVGSCSC